MLIKLGLQFNRLTPATYVVKVLFVETDRPLLTKFSFELALDILFPDGGLLFVLMLGLPQG